MMIVDCFTHTWESVDQLGSGLSCGPLKHPKGKRFVDPHFAAFPRHLAATQPVDTTFVLGFKSHYLGAEIPNDAVATYVANHPNKLLGFAGVDPSSPREAISELRRAHAELAMPGIAVAPAAQDFHPTNSNAMRVYAEAAALGMPILFHTGVELTAATKLEFAQPVLLDEIAREFPTLRIIIAHLGDPWVNETITLLAKHQNVYAEISRLTRHPWQAYQALLSAYQSGVMDKLLFGSGFPDSSASHSIESLYSINHLAHGTNLPTIPREQLRGIVERDTLGLLGFAPRADTQTSAINEDDAEPL